MARRGLSPERAEPHTSVENTKSAIFASDYHLRGSVREIMSLTPVWLKALAGPPRRIPMPGYSRKPFLAAPERCRLTYFNVKY